MKALLRTLLICASAQLAVQSASAVSFHGLATGGDRLLTFDQTGSVFNDVAITGLNASDSLVDIDVFFSGDRRLYGLGASGTLYTLNPQTGAASVNVLNAAVGSPTAIDFNPAADRLRIFSGDNNFRLTPNTGTVSVDGALAYAGADANTGANPNLVAAAYINNVDNPGATALYSIDADLNTLVLHSGGPQFSTLNTVASLSLNGSPFDVSDAAGFDVFSPAVGNNLAFLSNGNDLYSLNLTDGALTSLGTVASAVNLRSIASVPEGGNLLPAFFAAASGLVFLRAKRGRE